ncbi:Transposable element Tc3 transposase [Folsomia candida]|uniref:Transposable element Tc3 transposase n=1 Tax=Folsomia candida TaxID=158441 RepID=A0A226CW05_FOLCA|nr:Transposable element Tc3 transposase [Folsomia candida]
MPKGQPLSEFKLGQIQLIRDQSLSQQKIADFLGCSQSVISNSLNSKTHQGGENAPVGRPKVLTERNERKIAQLASTGKYSVRDIARELPISVSKDTVHRALCNNQDLQWRKIVTQPPLTQRHRDARLDFAREHMTWEKKWDKVVFSDEKKTDSAGYQDVLKANLIRQGSKIGGRGWIFQQDKASVHASRSTTDFLAAKNIRTLDWPARSPDLNPMENLWAELARRGYGHGRQYGIKRELEQAIHQEWANIPIETLRNLTDSMKRRIFEVILAHGGFTRY